MLDWIDREGKGEGSTVGTLSFMYSGDIDETKGEIPLAPPTNRPNTFFPTSGIRYRN